MILRQTLLPRTRSLREISPGGSRLPHSDSFGKGEEGERWGFAQILEHIDVGILVLDLQRRVIDYRNPLLGHVLQDEQLSGDYDALYGLLLREAEEFQHFCTATHRGYQVSYQGRLLGCSVYRPTDRYRCVFLRDITEKVRLESIAQAANAMDNIGYIFSGIRHEIGNPLNSLKMALSVLKSNLEYFSEQTTTDYIDRGLADIGRMEYLLKSLKAFSLYDHVDLRDLPVAEFMAKFISLVERDFHSRGICVEFEEPLDTVRVRIDKRGLHQALLNIFNNAADALARQRNPRILIGSELRGQLVWLTISDNGCGIPAEQQRHLFQPFNTSKAKGNGLGLVITRKLLAMMDSDIEIESEVKRGTRVTISLPVSPDKPEPVARAAASEKGWGR